ncbi:MAG: four helix bundle protein [Bacteroidetes bacterium]|nr:four helix bundle protein [Bacteroidota bacterium]
MGRHYDLEERLIEFSSRIINVVEELPQTRTGNYIAGQLIRCGLAPCLLYGEAQSAESRTDFIHKMKIVTKKLKETRVCLKLIRKRALIKSSRLNDIMMEDESLIAIFSKSIETAKKNNQKIN